jgi:hypothetical protein
MTQLKDIKIEVPLSASTVERFLRERMDKVHMPVTQDMVTEVGSNIYLDIEMMMSTLIEDAIARYWNDNHLDWED